jgi:hypothetical protein
MEIKMVNAKIFPADGNEWSSVIGFFDDVKIYNLVLKHSNTESLDPKEKVTLSCKQLARITKDYLAFDDKEDWQLGCLGHAVKAKTDVIYEVLNLFKGNITPPEEEKSLAAADSHMTTEQVVAEILKAEGL